MVSQQSRISVLFSACSPESSPEAWEPKKKKTPYEVRLKRCLNENCCSTLITLVAVFAAGIHRRGEASNLRLVQRSKRPKAGYGWWEFKSCHLASPILQGAAIFWSFLARSSHQTRSRHTERAVSGKQVPSTDKSKPKRDTCKGVLLSPL